MLQEKKAKLPNHCEDCYWYDGCNLSKKDIDCDYAFIVDQDDKDGYIDELIQMNRYAFYAEWNEYLEGWNK